MFLSVLGEVWWRRFSAEVL